MAEKIESITRLVTEEKYMSSNEFQELLNSIILLLKHSKDFTRPSVDDS
jgi:hypothetical protein